MAIYNEHFIIIIYFVCELKNKAFVFEILKQTNIIL